MDRRTPEEGGSEAHQHRPVSKMLVLSCLHWMLCSLLGGCRGRWRAVEGGGGLWRAVEGCGGLWRAVEGCGGRWRAVEGCGGLWRAVEGCGGLWRAVEGRGGCICFERSAVRFMCTVPSVDMTGPLRSAQGPQVADGGMHPKMQNRKLVGTIGVARVCCMFAQRRPQLALMMRRALAGVRRN